jgi:hypothetical protein
MAQHRQDVPTMQQLGALVAVALDRLLQLQDASSSYDGTIRQQQQQQQPLVASNWICTELMAPIVHSTYR